MKKLIAVLALAMALSAGVAEAGWWGNLNLFGSSDSQHKRRGAVTQQQEPVNVPEPASGILLATGILALIIGGAVERKGRKI